MVPEYSSSKSWDEISKFTLASYAGTIKTHTKHGSHFLQRYSPCIGEREEDEARHQRAWNDEAETTTVSVVADDELKVKLTRTSSQYLGRP